MSDVSFSGWRKLKSATPRDAARGMHELFDAPNGFTAWIAPDGEIRTAGWGDSHAEAAEIVTGIDDEGKAFDAMFGAGYVRLRASLWEFGRRSSSGPAEVVVGFAGKPTAAQKRVVQQIAREARGSKFFWSRWSPDPATWDKREETYGSDVESFAKENPPVKPYVSPPAVASAMRQVAADPGADPDARADAVAFLIGDVERRGPRKMSVASAFFSRIVRGARGAARAALAAVKPIRGNPKQKFEAWKPPAIPGGPELKLVRVSPGRRKPARSSEEIAKLFGFLAFQHNEEVWIALLDGKLRVEGRVLMTRGTVSSSAVYPSEILRVVLHAGTQYFAMAHCHPSGHVEPSADDIAITKRMQEACRLIGDIRLVDHVIIGDTLGSSGHLYGTPAFAPAPDDVDRAHGVAEKMEQAAGQRIYFSSLASLGLM